MVVAILRAAKVASLDGAFQVMDYPVIQVVFELVPNNSEFLYVPESSSGGRIKNHRIQAECIMQAQSRVWKQQKQIFTYNDMQPIRKRMIPQVMMVVT
jgi:hypothetical protein